jgi:acyl-CoA thioester hydrolase
LLTAGILVVRHEIEYLLPLKWRPEPVHIDLWLTKLGGAQIDVGYEVYDDPPGGSRIRYAVAESTLAIYDLANQRPQRLAAADIERLAPLRGEPVQFRRRR